MKKHYQILVVGAGAFGGWTALFLRQQGFAVTLIDALEPGNSRTSSGDETRILRTIYGPDQIYIGMAARALELWKEQERNWNRKLFHETGVLWLVRQEEDFVRRALPYLTELGLPFERFTAKEAAKRYPQIDFASLQGALLEHRAGFLLARQACKAVVEAFVAQGGEYRQVAVLPPVTPQEDELILSDGCVVRADHYIFACGSWMGEIFPDLLKQLITPMRQEVFFFGNPPGDPRFSVGHLPVWIDFGPSRRYGIPGNEERGFKLGNDNRGPVFDPTTDDRVASERELQAARDYLRVRFPNLYEAPLLEARVCAYEDTPDGHFIIDQHPQSENVWLVCGGSGHGFKHGPAIGELVAELITHQKSPPDLFRLSRFSHETHK